MATMIHKLPLVFCMAAFYELEKVAVVLPRFCDESSITLKSGHKTANICGHGSQLQNVAIRSLGG